MKNYKFIIETSCTLPDDFLKANNVTPLYMAISDGEGNVHIDKRTDEQKKWVSDQIENTGKVYTTSFINTGLMQEAVEKLLKECDYVVYVSLGTLYSGQYSSALETAKHFNGKFIVLHSSAIAVNNEILTRWTIEHFKMLSEKNLPVDVKFIESQYEEMNKHITTIFTTPKFEGLIKTGRVPPLVAKMLKIIKMYPLIVSEEINKRYKFYRKWSEAENQMLDGIDSRFKKLPRGSEIKELYIVSSILTKEYVQKLKVMLASHFSVSIDIIKVRTTPLVVFVSTLKDSFGVTIYTNTLEKIKIS